MGNLFGKITTDVRPLEDEINCDCSRSPTKVYNAAQRRARRPTTNSVYIDAQHRSRSQNVYITTGQVASEKVEKLLRNIPVMGKTVADGFIKQRLGEKPSKSFWDPPKKTVFVDI